MSKDRDGLTTDGRRHPGIFKQVDRLCAASEAVPDLAYLHRILALCSLPRTNPGNTKEFRRVNGPITLGMVAGLDNKLPYGNILRHAWKHGQRLRNAEVHRIDAFEHFGASVDACLFIVSGSPQIGEAECAVYDSLQATSPSSRFGFRGGELVADLQLYDRWKHLAENGPQRYQWRSGVKHDCSKIMELRRCGPNSYVNGFQQEVELEQRFLFPMLKSSELANSAVVEPTRWMLVTQSAIGEDTAHIESEAPHTWRYLCAHSSRLDRRSSTIYQNRPRFSVFGVGAYTFQPWRVAISGFYKKLNFRVVGSFETKPIVLDDTCYFVPCGSKAEAVCVRGLLHSEPAQEFLNAFVFWDSKRPVTGGLLNHLGLLAVAQEIAAEDELCRFETPSKVEPPQQQGLSWPHGTIGADA